MANKPPFVGERVKLSDLCTKGKSTLRQKDVLNNGPYPVYGASGIIGTMSAFQNEVPCVCVVKDGAGVGRVMACEACSSVLGTMQALIPKDGVDNDYLLHLVRSLKLGEGFSGSTIPHIYFKDYCKRTVPSLSLAQQAKISSAFGLIESLTGQKKLALDKLDQLIKSRFVEMFGNPTEPGPYPLFSIGDLYHVKSSKRIYSREQTKEGIPFYRLADVGNLIDGVRPRQEIFISTDHYEKLKGSGMVPIANDVLVTARGTLGKCYVIKEEDKFYFQDGMITWLSQTVDSPLATWIVELFANQAFLADLNENCSGTTVKYLSLRDLADRIIPVPPIELQQQFADFVARVDKSRFVVQQQIDKLQTLYDSLAQEYFGD